MAKQTDNKQELELGLETTNTEQVDKVTDELIKSGKAGDSVAKQWTVVKQFRDIKDFNLIHKVGDIVEHTQEREDNGLIELK